MTKIERTRLERTALRARETVLRLAGRGGCFVGAALSCLDILVVLYGRVLRVSPDRADDPDRDYFFLSKGHAVPALYSVLQENGWFPEALLTGHCAGEGNIYWHPHPSVPGVEFHSGSLGHLLPLAVGVALDAQMRRSPSRVFVLVGDGELDEGSNWEALLLASAKGLDNLVVIVDRNGLQANLPTESLVPLEPLAAKGRAFGAAVKNCRGHSLSRLDAALGAVPFAPGKPSLILAATVRGKGVPSLEARADRWFCAFSADEVEAAVAELKAAASTAGPAAAKE